MNDIEVTVRRSDEAEEVVITATRKGMKWARRGEVYYCTTLPWPSSPALIEAESDAARRMLDRLDPNESPQIQVGTRMIVTSVDRTTGAVGLVQDLGERPSEWGRTVKGTIQPWAPPEDDRPDARDLPPFKPRVP